MTETLLPEMATSEENGRQIGRRELRLHNFWTTKIKANRRKSAVLRTGRKRNVNSWELRIQLELPKRRYANLRLCRTATHCEYTASANNGVSHITEMSPLSPLNDDWGKKGEPRGQRWRRERSNERSGKCEDGRTMVKRGPEEADGKPSLV